MMPVLGRPPENALLRRALGKGGKDKLKYPARAVGAMRKVAVVARTDGEHAKPVESDSHSDRRPRHACPDCTKAGEVNQEERYDIGVEDILSVGRLGASICRRHEWPIVIANSEPTSAADLLRSRPLS